MDRYCLSLPSTPQTSCPSLHTSIPANSTRNSVCLAVPSSLLQRPSSHQAPPPPTHQHIPPHFINLAPVCSQHDLKHSRPQACHACRDCAVHAGKRRPSRRRRLGSWRWRGRGRLLKAVLCPRDLATMNLPTTREDVCCRVTSRRMTLRVARAAPPQEVTWLLRPLDKVTSLVQDF